MEGEGVGDGEGEGEDTQVLYNTGILADVPQPLSSIQLLLC